MESLCSRLCRVKPPVGTMPTNSRTARKPLRACACWPSFTAGCSRAVPWDYDRVAMIKALAAGPFEVKLSPLTPYAQSEDAKLGRMSIDKEFHGGLEAVSKGEMLSAGSVVKGPAAYVAIERVRGALDGKKGRF